MYSLMFHGAWLVGKALMSEIDESGSLYSVTYYDMGFITLVRKRLIDSYSGVV